MQAITTYRAICGEILCRRRKAASINADDIAQKLGLSRPMISKYERGITVIRVEMLHALRDLIKTTPSEFMRDVETSKAYIEEQGIAVSMKRLGNSDPEVLGLISRAALRQLVANALE